jgi:hypothetical protein
VCGYAVAWLWDLAQLLQAETGCELVRQRSLA